MSIVAACMTAMPCRGFFSTAHFPLRGGYISPLAFSHDSINGSVANAAFPPGFAGSLPCRPSALAAWRSTKDCQLSPIVCGSSPSRFSSSGSGALSLRKPCRRGLSCPHSLSMPYTTSSNTHLSRLSFRSIAIMCGRIFPEPPSSRSSRFLWQISCVHSSLEHLTYCLVEGRLALKIKIKTMSWMACGGIVVDRNRLRIPCRPCSVAPNGSRGMVPCGPRKTDRKFPF